MVNTKTVDLVYFNAGGGHRASALALQSVLQTQGWPWQVRLVNLFEVLDPKDKFRKLTGNAPEDWYNQRLARGWTIGMAQELKLLQGLIRLSHPMLVRQLQQHWLHTEPDLVVSLVPNFNKAMFESLASALPGVPYVTVLTDLADVPPNFWMERQQPQHFVCGTPRALEQARAMGHDASRLHATSGMIIRPAFYEPLALDRASEQRRLGLDPSRPTGLVLFGGHGSKAMLGIARQLADSTQLILVCGHNQALARRLQALPGSAPRLVVGFTTDIPRYMQLADFFIGKPGPGSLSEAVQQGLPVIVVDNALTMPQERYNAQWIRENELGMVLRSFRRVDVAVANLLGQLEHWRSSVQRMRNRALFEVPPILADILSAADRPQGGLTGAARAGIAPPP
ncbi:MAG TPA: glycosyltransferase [Hydrogenophaga sp.]|nr:glycosyltransferase [Hydrogenophaga sp.]